MKTISYKTVDKSAWERGPWDQEPDKLQWSDRSTGLPCLIVRNRIGCMCGYVGVQRGHPLYRKGVARCRKSVDVYDGVTYADFCQQAEEADGDGEARLICHVPGPGEPDDVWWIGFATSTSRDVHPALVKSLREMMDDALFSENPWHPTYKDVKFVKRECRMLARQLKAMA